MLCHISDEELIDVCFRVPFACAQSPEAIPLPPRSAFPGIRRPHQGRHFHAVKKGTHGCARPSYHPWPLLLWSFCVACIFVRLRSSCARGSSRRRLACTLSQRIVAPYLRRLSYSSLIKYKVPFSLFFFSYLGLHRARGRRTNVSVCVWMGEGWACLRVMLRKGTPTVNNNGGREDVSRFSVLVSIAQLADLAS